MTEVDNDTRRSSWLEKELTRQLCPVSAPDSLWRRIHEQRRSLQISQKRSAVWLAAVVALGIVSAALVGRVIMKRHPANLQSLGEREVRGIANGSGTIDFRSNDPSKIRTWVKKRSGLDVKLPKRQLGGGEAVRLFGARLIYVEGLPVTAITYRVGEDFAALLVTGRRETFRETRKLGHVAPEVKVTGDMRFVSWNMGGELYTIALADITDPQRECLLCHAEPHGLLGRM